MPADAVAGLAGPALVFTQDGTEVSAPAGWSPYEEVVGGAPAQDPHRDSTR